MDYTKTLKYLWFYYKEDDEMSDQEKLDSGRYILVRSDILKIRSITTLLSVLALILLIARKWDLTFDDQAQKQSVISHSETISPIEVKLLKQKQDDILSELKDIKKILNEKEK